MRISVLTAESTAFNAAIDSQPLPCFASMVSLRPLLWFFMLLAPAFAGEPKGNGLLVSAKVIFAVDKSTRHVVFRDAVEVDTSDALPHAFLHSGSFALGEEDHEYFRVEYYDRRGKVDICSADAAAIAKKADRDPSSVWIYPPNLTRFFIPSTKVRTVFKCFPEDLKGLYIQAVTPLPRRNVIAILYQGWSGGMRIRTYSLKKLAVMSDSAVKSGLFLHADTVDWISDHVVLVQQRRRRGFDWFLIDTATGTEIKNAMNVLVRISGRNFMACPMTDDEDQNVTPYLFYHRE